MWCSVFLICFYLITNGYSTPRVDPLVQTKVGLIRGEYVADGDYSSFKGIPYAKIDPTNPFGLHLNQPPFETTFNAVDDTARCPQGNGQGTFDCLILNIFVPSSASSQNPLPVMLWIYGGAFQSGSLSSSTFGPKYLMKKDVILVTINYRVGLYGFMCLDIPEVPGNAGLKDQAAALKWIKENIAAFGGDDNNITIFGGSAGAASVDLQLRYNKDDVINKVIMQSGTAAGSWAIQRPNRKLAIEIANRIGFETSGSLEAVNYLATQTPSTVLSAFRQLSSETWPCVEQEFAGVDRFIDDYAMNLEIPRAKNTPIMVGYTDDEWLSRYANQGPAYFQTLQIFKKNLLEAFDLNEAELKEVEDIVKRFYLGDDALSRDKVLEIAAFDTDFTFVHPIETAIRQYVENGGKSVYRYLFTYVGGRNHIKYGMKTDLGGAYHGDEKGYIFDISSLPEPNDEDQRMIERHTTMWTNFAKYGDPTPETNELLPVKWLPSTANTSHYLEMGKEFVAATGILHDRVAFWDLIYKMNQFKRWGYKPKVDDN